MNYYLHKWVREGDRASEKRKAERSLKKFRKKCMISTYGYDYYLRDKTWEKIKNQKKKETYEAWKRRLNIYGFTIHGYDIRRNEVHYGKPLVHEYNFYDSCSNIDFFKKEKEKTMEKLTWTTILDSFTKSPRDVVTKRGLWFYAYGDGKNVYVEKSRDHKISSNISVTRTLDFCNFETIFDMFINKSPSAEIQSITRNASYWFAIFREMLVENE